MRDEVPVQSSLRKQNAVAIDLRKCAFTSKRFKALFRNTGMNNRARFGVPVSKPNGGFGFVHGFEKRGLCCCICAWLDINIRSNRDKTEGLWCVEFAPLRSEEHTSELQS